MSLRFYSSRCAYGNPVMSLLCFSCIDNRLHNATRKGEKSTIERLIVKGVDVNAKDNRGNTPLHKAAIQHMDIAELLITNGADVNTKNKYGYTPLHEAASARNLDVAKLLIARGANVNARNNAGDTPLNRVVTNWGISAYLVLRSYKPAPGSKNAMIELLIVNGADINTRNNNGYTPLQLATLGGDSLSETAELLIKYGAKK